MAMETTTSFLTRRSFAPSRIASSSFFSSCRRPRGLVLVALPLENKNNGIQINAGKKSVPNSNYVVPLDSSSSSCLTRPLAEIFRDLNKKVPDNIVQSDSGDIYIPWYHANRMLSFYAPGWCGEIRNILYSDKSVTIVYRVTIRGTDGEAYRESIGMASLTDREIEDPVAVAEEIAFLQSVRSFWSWLVSVS